MNKIPITSSKGFTILELLGGLLIFSGLILAMFKFLNDMSADSRNKNQADQINPIAKAAINYIQLNYQQISQQSSSAPVVISWSTLSAAGYIPTGYASSLHGEIPCLVISQNSNKQLTPLMYFAKSSSIAKTHNLDSIRLIAFEFGAAGGYYSSTGAAIGLGNSWRVPNASTLFNAGLCGGTTIQTNSLVINLALLSDFNANAESDDSIRRVADSSTILGKQQNFNTVSTDITLHQLSGGGVAERYNKLVLNSSSNMSLAVNPNNTNGIILENGSIVANTITPAGNQLSSTLILPGTVCTDKLLGTWASQNQVGDYAAKISGNQLQCTYNQFACVGNDPSGRVRYGYCYLPISNNQISTNNPGADASCPAGYTIMQDVSTSGSTCSCITPGYQTGGIYFTYDAYYVGGLQVRLAAHGFCSCSNGQGRAIIPQLKCSNGAPTITYAR